MTTSTIFGILGGMGPQASCELYRLVNQKMCSAQSAVGNASFPHLLINSLPVPDLIADRTRETETVAMTRDAAFALQRAGATDIIMSCNTMHLFQDRITHGLDASFHSLINIVVDAMRPAKKILLLGSHTTITTGLYQEKLEVADIDYREPSAALRELSVTMILATIGQTLTPVMIDSYVNAVLREAKNDADIDTIGLVCTELPLFFPSQLDGLRVISSLDVAAEHIVFLHGKE
jgi:aspartate/glutamate racemase